MTDRCDQETLLSRAGDEDVWHVWSTDRREMGRIRRLAERLNLPIKSGQKGGAWLDVQFPASKVRILISRIEKKRLEGPQREAALERMRIAREAGRTRERVGAKAPEPTSPERRTA